MTKPNPVVFLTILLMGVLTGAEIDLFIPSFPELQAQFNLSPFEVELTIALNLLANCFFAFFVGNLGDRYGRKPIILLGILVFIVGSILCVTANSYPSILIGRVFQGIGITGPAILGYIMIADLYSLEEQAKKFAFLNGFISISMALAPVIGSFVNQQYGWRGNFGVLLILGCICSIFALLFLPKGEMRPHISLSLREYASVFKSKKILLYIATICACFQPYFIFVAISPILYMQDLGVSLSHFGYYQGVLALAFGLMSFTSPIWIKRWGARRCFLVSLGGLVIFILSATVMCLINVRSPLAITIIAVIEEISLVLPFTILWTLMLQTNAEARGKIAAVFASVRLFVTAMGIQITSYFYTHSFCGVGLAMILSTGLSLMGIAYLFKKDNLSVRIEEIAP